MIRLDFNRPLTAIEIRDPAVEVCREIAEEHGLHATFHQSQQAAFTGHPHMPRAKRQRIGNGKHKEWRIDYQLEEPKVSHPTVVGRLLLRGPYIPGKVQFGGFDYGKYGEPKPEYSHITVHTPTELGYGWPIDPTVEMLELSYEGLRQVFEVPYPRLFDITNYDSV
ncbi:MAG: hypothetical protein ABI354_00580 [Candidatus Saccharimonadales bacterium]